jgi:excisionase family DNA binding protein
MCITLPCSACCREARSHRGGAVDVLEAGSLSVAPPVRKRREPSKSSLPRRLCSLTDAARYLAVSDWTVRQMVWRGDFPHIKTGKRILLDLRDLDGWIEREKVRGV